MPYWSLCSSTHCSPASMSELLPWPRPLRTRTETRLASGAMPASFPLCRVGAVAHQDAGHVRAVPVGVDAARGCEGGIVGSDEVDGGHEPRELGTAGHAAVDHRDRHARALERALGHGGRRAGRRPRATRRPRSPRPARRWPRTRRRGRRRGDSSAWPGTRTVIQRERCWRRTLPPNFVDQRTLAGAGLAPEADDHVDAGRAPAFPLGARFVAELAGMRGRRGACAGRGGTVAASDEHQADDCGDASTRIAQPSSSPFLGLRRTLRATGMPSLARVRHGRSGISRAIRELRPE